MKSWLLVDWLFFLNFFYVGWNINRIIWQSVSCLALLIAVYASGKVCKNKNKNKIWILVGENVGSVNCEVLQCVERSDRPCLSERPFHLQLFPSEISKKRTCSSFPVIFVFVPSNIYRFHSYPLSPIKKPSIRVLPSFSVETHPSWVQTSKTFSF